MTQLKNIFEKNKVNVANMQDTLLSILRGTQTLFGGKDHNESWTYRTCKAMNCKLNRVITIINI